jgi:hypothetical protein
VPTSTTETLDAWREGPHDDLVLAVAIAAWRGERCHTLQVFAPYTLDSRRAWLWRH